MILDKNWIKTQQNKPLLLLSLFVLLISVIKLVVYPNIPTKDFSALPTYNFSSSRSIDLFYSDLSFFKYTSRADAEERVIRSFPENLQMKVRKVIRPVLVLCEKYQIDPFWALAVMWTESHFKNKAVSHKGANGMMQIMPITFDALLVKMKEKNIRMESEMGHRYLSDAYEDFYSQLNFSQFAKELNNLEVGIFYLSELLNEFTNHKYATIAYNMGPSWTRLRLKNNGPVGVKNKYLSKVMKAYTFLVRNLPMNERIAFVQNQP